MTQKVEFKELRSALAELSASKLFTYFGIGDKQEFLRSCEGNWNLMPAEVQKNFIKQIKIVAAL